MPRRLCTVSEAAKGRPSTRRARAPVFYIRRRIGVGRRVVGCCAVHTCACVRVCVCLSSTAFGLGGVGDLLGKGDGGGGGKGGFLPDRTFLSFFNCTELRGASRPPLRLVACRARQARVRALVAPVVVYRVRFLAMLRLATLALVAWFCWALPRCPLSTAGARRYCFPCFLCHSVACSGVSNLPVFESHPGATFTIAPPPCVTQPGG